jgi:hypothetical protein
MKGGDNKMKMKAKSGKAASAQQQWKKKSVSKAISKRKWHRKYRRKRRHGVGNGERQASRNGGKKWQK